MKLKLIIIFLFLGFLSAQQRYLSPDDVKVEWQNYTSFQRQELVNFATFLYDEEFYERALLVYFSSYINILEMCLKWLLILKSENVMK